MEPARITPTKVFLVEDSPAIRMRLVDLLGEVKGVEIVGGADSPGSAIEGIQRMQPDFVVLDVHLLGGSGLEVLREVHPANAGIVFIVLTNHPDCQSRQIYTEAGASYFLDKSSDFEKVKEVIAGLGANRSCTHDSHTAII